MSTRRRVARQPQAAPEKNGAPDEVAPTPDIITESLIMRRVFSYLILASATAGLLFVYYTYFLFDVPPAALQDAEELLQPFVVVDLPGRGRGAIATKDIMRGDLILREEPLFVVPNLIRTSPGALLLSQLSVLSARQRQKFYNLSYVRMSTDLEPQSPAYNEAIALAIFQTNSIAAGSNTGIFPRTARLNHGCSKAFNSVYTWRENENVVVVHALRNISQGEELLTTYTDTKRSRDERRQYLQTLYDFECGCSVCSLSEEDSKASDARLTKMAQLKGTFATWGGGVIGGREAADIAREIWSLGEEEGYWSERGQLAADVVWVAAAHSDMEATRAWGEAAAEWYGYELGRDSPQVEEMRRVIAQPMLHAMWGQRLPERVGDPVLS